jgi:hypothetical protein
MTYEIGALLSELKYLRKKVTIFEQHHKCCPIDLSPIDDESTKLQIIPFSPSSTNLKPHNKIPRWRQIADDILRDALIGTQWTERRKTLGLATTEGVTWLTSAILGAHTQVFGQRTGHLADGVMVSAQVYAKSTKAAQEYSDMFYQIRYFMELVFVSLCAVLEILDYPVDDINNTMRILLSDSEDANLKRLRRGALWVNRTIADMCKAGAGDYSTEFFFLCTYAQGTWFG